MQMLCAAGLHLRAANCLLVLQPARDHSSGRVVQLLHDWGGPTAAAALMALDTDMLGPHLLRWGLMQF